VPRNSDGIENLPAFYDQSSPPSPAIRASNGKRHTNGLNSRPSDAARSVEYGRRISGRALTDDFDLGDDHMDMDMSPSFCRFGPFAVRNRLTVFD
jgi:hypothetical protein